MPNRKFSLLLENAALYAVQVTSAVLLWWLKRKFENWVSSKLTGERKMSPVAPMTKAYDLKNLVARLAAKGIVVAESAAEVLVEETFGWVEESAVISENKVDDLVALGLPHARKVIKPFLDKIDGQEG